MNKTELIISYFGTRNLQLQTGIFYMLYVLFFIEASMIFVLLFASGLGLFGIIFFTFIGITLIIGGVQMRKLKMRARKMSEDIKIMGS